MAISTAFPRVTLFVAVVGMVAPAPVQARWPSWFHSLKDAATSSTTIFSMYADIGASGQVTVAATDAVPPPVLRAAVPPDAAPVAVKPVAARGAGGYAGGARPSAEAAAVPGATLAAAMPVADGDAAVPVGAGEFAAPVTADDATVPVAAGEYAEVPVAAGEHAQVPVAAGAHAQAPAAGAYAEVPATQGGAAAPPSWAAESAGVQEGSGSFGEMEPATSTQLQALPVAGDRRALGEEERRALCELGLPWACQTAAGALIDPSERREFHERLLAEKATLNSTLAGASRACLGPGPQRRIFMQTHGVPQRAMADYMDCTCNFGEHCHVVRDAGPKFATEKEDAYFMRVLAGGQMDPQTLAARSCAPRICTTASDFERRGRRGRCGPEYQQAPVFTMLREPVLRVYSFYVYMQSWYTPYRHHSLEQVLEAIGKKDLNEGLPKSEVCRFCERQLTNAMTLFYFCGLGGGECKRLQKQGLEAKPLEMAMALDAAKELMSKSLSAVFLEKDNKEFMDNFHAIPELLPQVQRQPQCKFKACKMEPVLSLSHLPEQTVALITQHNAADSALYSHAVRSMPNVVRVPQVVFEP